MANPVNETPEQARARTAATAQANIEARKANAQSNVNTTTNNQMGAVQPVAQTPQPIATQPVQVAQTVQQPTQPSYTSQEGITTVSPVTETPEQARARTEATAQANISAREQVQPKPTIAQQVPEVTKEIPISTAPTSMPKKEVPVIDYNSSVGRESEIQKNLQEGLATNPSLFKDKNAFFQAYGYNQADAGKQTLLAKFFEDNAQKVGTPEGIFDLLSAGQRNFDKSTKNSPAYTQAQARYDYIAPYKNATATSLYNAMVSGKLSPESGSYQDLVNISGGVETPAMQEAKKKYETKRNIDTINRNAEINHSSSTGTSLTPATSPTQTISNDIISTKGISYAEAFKKAVSENPELVKQSTELTAVSNRILELEDQKAEIMKGIEKQYPGITTGAATLLANQQSEAINKEYDQLQNKQAVMTANLNYKTSLAEKMFDYDVKQAETTRQEELAKAASETAFNRQKELADYQAKLGLQTKKAEFAQNLELQAQQASDPYTAIKTVMDEYQKLGVPFTESLATKLQNFKNSGMTIGDYTKQMIKDIQAKPEYKRINELTLGQLSDREKLSMQSANKTPDWKQDTSGNWYNANALVSPALQTTSATGDLRSYASQFPNEASLKNNNPAGITFNSTFAKTLENAGIQFEKGTARPAAEGGNYFSFPNIEEGFKAYDLLWSSPSYQNLTVGAALNRWGTGSLPGVDTTKKVSDLTEDERRTLQMAQIKKESPGMYKVLSSQQKQTETSTEPKTSNYPQYIKFVENGTLPVGVKDGTAAAEKFKKDAEVGYINAKNAQVGASGFNIQDPTAFAATSTKQKEDISTAIKQVQPFSDSMDRLIKLVEEYGTENPWTESGKKMAAEVKNAQLIAKEIYNLGVLNGPDLSLMEAIIQNPTSGEANTLGTFQDYVSLLKNAKQTIISNAAANARTVGLEFKGDTNSSNTESTQDNWDTFYGEGTTAPTTVSSIFNNY